MQPAGHCSLQPCIKIHATCLALQLGTHKMYFLYAYKKYMLEIHNMYLLYAYQTRNNKLGVGKCWPRKPKYIKPENIHLSHDFYRFQALYIMPIRGTIGPRISWDRQAVYSSEQASTSLTSSKQKWTQAPIDTYIITCWGFYVSYVWMVCMCVFLMISPGMCDLEILPFNPTSAI